MKYIGCLLFSFSLLLSSAVLAQKKPAPPQKGRTLSMENAVYASPSFDSKVLAVLPEGKVFAISNNLFAGAFYKIRLNEKTIGYIADSDIKPLNQPANQKSATKKNSKTALKEEPKKDTRRRPFEFSRFVGFSYQIVNFQEETMGAGRKEEMNVFGLKLSGADVLIEGMIPTEMNIQYSPEAPGYYQKVTGVGASGWIFFADFLLQTYIPQSKSSFFFVGFGPMFRFSKFDVGVKDTTSGVVTNYSMQDMALGAAFNAGYALRISNIALRLEAKYHWEKKSYLGYGFSLQFPF